MRAEDVAFTAGGFDAHAVGLVWDTFSLDLVTAHLECGPPQHQPYGIVHGGVWCSVVETVASTAAALRVAGDGRLTVGVSNTTDFLRSHREGRVDAVATPIHVGRLQQLWQVELTRASDGKAVARGQVRLQNVDPAQLS
ncbi:PaaI family thioesterase [Nitriliruptor alkaliphilus]|uniref:PaaI family thioesterase n=1 Tax=Nitriliruptor alkaliphilus TaxID=427918 RepID=UPI000696C8ED